MKEHPEKLHCIDVLKPCGSCVSALVAGPKFDKFPEGDADDAYERAASCGSFQRKEFNSPSGAERREMKPDYSVSNLLVSTMPRTPSVTTHLGALLASAPGAGKNRDVH